VQHFQEVAGGYNIGSNRCLQKKIEDFSVFLNFGKLSGKKLKDTIKQILVSLDMKVNSFSETGLGLTIPFIV
jgi:phenylalanyl-tRNA synthetase beta chain